MATIQYMPNEHGGYNPYARVPRSTRDVAEGEHNVAVVAPGSREIAVVDRRGRELFRHGGEMLQGVRYQPTRDSFVVQDYGAIDVISARDGALKARIEPENASHQTSLNVLSDGRVLLNVARYDLQGQLVMLKPDLEPEWTHPTGLLNARSMELPDGKIAAFAGPHLEICDARGAIVHRSDKMLSDPQLKDGKLYYLEAKWMKQLAGRVGERSNAVVLCQHDLQTGLTRTTPTSDNCETLTLLHDGRILLSERAAHHYAMVVHDADGKMEKRFKLPEDGVSGSLELSADGKKAFVMEGSVLATPVVFRLQQLDLEKMEMTEVYRSPNPFLVASLTDGRTALFEKTGVRILEDGSHFATQKEFVQSLPEGVGPAHAVAESQASNFTSPGPGPARWDRLFQRVQQVVELEGAAALTARPGESFVTYDNCVNFMLPAVDALPAAVAAASRPVKVSDLFHEKALPVWLSRETSGYSILGDDGEKKTFYGRFNHVLPFLAEERPVVAATEGNILKWWDPKRLPTPINYNAGEPIVSLEPGQDGASVIARTESGQILHLYPDKLDKLREDTPPAPDDQPVGNLQENRDGIRLPGVFIRKYGRSQRA